MRKLKRRQVYMTDEEVKAAQSIGGGNMSKGIREALKRADGLASREANVVGSAAAGGFPRKSAALPF